MIIRQATTADAEEIASVYIETWRDSYAGIIPDHVLVNMSHRRQAADWRGAIANGHGGHQVLVAEDDIAGVIGFGSCGRARETGLPYRGEVYTFYVHPDHQGEGVGKSLLRELFRALSRNAMGSALIWVLADNPARFFYEARGGRLVAMRDQRLWGTVLQEKAYGWDDLAAATGRRARQRLPHGR